MQYVARLYRNSCGWWVADGWGLEAILWRAVGGGCSKRRATAMSVRQGGRVVRHTIRCLSVPGSTGSRPCPLVSERGARAPSLLPSYLADARAVQGWSEKTPDGCINLSVAENHMVSDTLSQRLKSASDVIGFDPELIFYQPTPGRADLRTELARQMSSSLYASEYSLDPERLVVGAGCNAVLENLLFTIAPAGSAVLIPSPSYAAFQFDLGARAGIELVPVVPDGLMKANQSAVNLTEPQAYYPSNASLDAAYAAALAKGLPPTALLVSSPHNPTGIVYPPEVIALMISWCEANGLHYVSDEIYGGASAWSATAARSSAPLVLRNELGRRELGSRVHIVYAISKDWALSGLRMGYAIRTLFILCCILTRATWLLAPFIVQGGVHRVRSGFGTAAKAERPLPSLLAYSSTDNRGASRSTMGRRV